MESILKSLTSIYTKKLNKTKRLNRIRIKDICLSSNILFQIPFSFNHIERYKGISCYHAHDCFFQVMTVLGLRHYSVSKRDSRKIYNEMSRGVEVHDAAKYLSTIFGTTIRTNRINPCGILFENIKVNKNDHMTIIDNLFSYMTIALKNGYATFICAVLYNTINNR